MEAFFEQSLVLTFAVPQEELNPLVPECLTLDTFQDKWAFIAVALVQTRGLRPKGFPAFLGNNFFLIGYRVFVRYTNAAGNNLRGLYILQSQTNKKKMELLGNIFTHYNYSTTDIRHLKQKGGTEISSLQANFRIVTKEMPEETGFPAGSVFSDWKEARRFAGPLPFTFSYLPKTNKVVIIEGVRQNWRPVPVRVKEYHFSFLQGLNLSESSLASAFLIQNVPYYWKKGKIEQWNS